MELQDSDIVRFKKLHKEKFDIELDDTTTRQKLSLLVRQMEFVYQPITKKQLEELRIKQDAADFAELLYDIYQEEKHTKRQAKRKSTDNKPAN